MKRRGTVFALVWAFSLNALFVPGGLDCGYVLSLLAPAWYLFLLGVLVGGAHEALASRWPRLWVTLALAGTLAEISVMLFGGRVLGLSLAVPVVLATALASWTARNEKLARHRAVPWLGRALLGISIFTLMKTAACQPYWEASTQQEVSPDGSCVFRTERSFFGSDSNYSVAVHMGPRHAPADWFGSVVAHGHGKVARWENSRTLLVHSRKPLRKNEHYLTIQIKHAH
jgi:hypothetical protein